MNNPYLFNKDLLETGAKLVITTNESIAKVIGINPAARTTTVKPSGNASVVLGTASGIHPDHAKKLFRIMQLNKEANSAKWLKANMPYLLEESYWSATNSDYAVFVPIENPEDGLYKDQMKGVKHLEYIKFVQEHWVNAGTNVKHNLKPWLRNSVSCTVIIDDLQEITRYIYDNEDYFKAVSFISDYGDKEFTQAPFTSVLTLEEIIEEYGRGALFASGLIVDGLHYFDNNLWVACDTVLKKEIPIDGTREQVLLKKYWIRRAKKFAKNFFNGDIVKTIYCLKDVHLLHKWEVINRDFKEVDFGKILDKPTYKEVSAFAAVACSGGACEITTI
jgi:ribonucleoside-diphosphate reductase alpha chain